MTTSNEDNVVDLFPRLTVYCKKLSATAKRPTSGSEEAIGLDIYADLGIGETRDILKDHIVAIPTGLAMVAPPGHYFRAAPRSGLAMKGVDVLAGVIDRDYRGEVKVLLTTHGFERVTIKHGDRIAQMIAERASLCTVEMTDDLPQTARSAGGFGSTGA